MYDRCVYHCFTDDRIWASLGKAGIKVARHETSDDITPQLWHDRHTTAKVKVQREWHNQLITYYATKMDSTVRWDQQSTLG